MKKTKIFYGWWIVLATNIICMLGFGTWLYAFGTFFEPMMVEFNWTRAQTSGAASFRSVEGGIAGPVVGWAVDKFGARNVIRVGAVISGLGFAAMPLVNSLIGFYLIYGILVSIGMSAMLYIPAFTVIAKWFSRRLSFAISILAIGAGLGGFICTPIAALLISNYGWRSAFLILGITIWVVVLPLTFLIKNSPEEIGLRCDNDPPLDVDLESDAAQQGPNGSQESANSVVEVDYTLKQALASSTFWIIAVTLFFQSMAHNVVFVHGVIALTDGGIAYAQAAFAIGLLTLVSLIGRLVFGYLGDHIDKRYLFTVSYFMIGAGVLTLSYAHEMMIVYVFIALFGIGFGATIPLMAAIRAEYFGRAALGKIQGFMTPVTMLAGATGPITAGYLFDTTGSYQIAFWAVGLLPFIGGILILFARPTKLSGNSA
ncbi:MAG: MFS transporter [Proteobacteria bacterium]|nr:MFS transporter [Pseudomonadota bacterium]